ncbi:MAG: class II aldolase/adducin family protein [Phycisphaerae bacterium]|nr:class II aldolase/adducin family protein [Phycisphaerae bacterium]
MKYSEVKNRIKEGAGLAELIYISRRVGRDPDLTCGASGNTSVKTPDGKYMFIKASGTELKNMSAKKGWCKINLQKVREIVKDKKLSRLSPKKRGLEISRRLTAACQGNIKPSIESNLHAFLDKYVIHLHPIMVCAFLITKNGKAELEKLFADMKPAPLWVSYAKPGYELAKKVGKLTIQYQKRYGRRPKILFLEKHGLFVCAASAKEALKLVEKVINRCESKINASPLRRRLNREKIIALCAAHDIPAYGG